MKYSFILVDSKVPENIGASARALKTMGFSSLVLINPGPDPEGRAKWLAHGSHDILESAQIYGSLAEVRDQFDILIATTTRKRKVQTDLIPVNRLTDYIKHKEDTIEKVGIVFGNEESGLSNSDLSLCHISSEIPLAVDFPSLNLSQAVMLYAYVISQSTDGVKDDDKMEATEKNTYRIINDKVIDLLNATGLADNPALAGKILERLAQVGGKDLNLIHTITRAALDKIKNKEH